MRIAALPATTAERIVENLRYGIPPSGHVRAFTVGRDDQLAQLRASLARGPDDPGALLLRANYGAGKSHLLRVTREIALELGYAVSLVEVNAQEGVRFNRMDTILGAVCREIEVGTAGEVRGIGELFDRFCDTSRARLPADVRKAREAISAKGKWDYSEALACPGMFVALRAWALAGDSSRELISDWLSNPPNYRGQRKVLYERLVGSIRTRARDPRADWQFYYDDVFLFHVAGHRHAWDALADLDLIAKASGLRGMVLLFDEFEDVIQNLNRRDYQENAFMNLFRFFGGARFPGMAYFAVTPDFVRKCKEELLSRGSWDFDYERFDLLQAFELESLSSADGLRLAKRIRDVHGRAYAWDASRYMTDVALRKLVETLWRIDSPDRVRHAIQSVVRELDTQMEATT
jgi:BREX system ATP-binding protein BrxC/D